MRLQVLNRNDLLVVVEIGCVDDALVFNVFRGEDARRSLAALVGRLAPAMLEAPLHVRETVHAVLNMLDCSVPQRHLRVAVL